MQDWVFRLGCQYYMQKEKLVRNIKDYFQNSNKKMLCHSEMPARGLKNTLRPPHVFLNISKSYDVEIPSKQLVRIEGFFSELKTRNSI